MNKKMIAALALLLATASGTAAAQVKTLELEEIAKPLSELRLDWALVAHRLERVDLDELAEAPDAEMVSDYVPPAYDD